MSAVTTRRSPMTRFFEAGRQSRQIEIAAAMRERHYTLQAIGDVLGVSRQAVHQMLADQPQEN